MVGDAGVSIEVFADLSMSAEQMLAHGEEMFSWIPNAYIKYPCTKEGLRAASRALIFRVSSGSPPCHEDFGFRSVHKHVDNLNVGGPSQ